MLLLRDEQKNRLQMLVYYYQAYIAVPVKICLHILSSQFLTNEQ